MEQTLDLGIWMEMAEGRCKRAGDLIRQLENDKARLLRRMEMDKILPTWLKRNLPEELRNPSSIDRRLGTAKQT